MATAVWLLGIARPIAAESGESPSIPTQSVQSDRERSEALVAEGDDWYGKGEWDKAIAAYDEAVRLDPENAVAFKNRGATRNKTKEFDLAIADFEHAIRLKPGFAAAFLFRGINRHLRGDVERAMVDYDEAIRLNPKFAAAYYQRGKAHYLRGDAEKAGADYDEAIRLGKADPHVIADAHYLRALLRTDRGDPEGAIADYGEAIRLWPEYFPAWSNRGFVHLGLGEWEAAERDWKETLRIRPDDHITIGNLATLRAACPNDRFRNGQEAIDLARKACEATDWKDAGLVGTLAAAYAETGDFKAAREWQIKAIGLAAPDAKPRFRQSLETILNHQPLRLEPQLQRKPV